MLARLDDGPYPLKATLSCIRGVEAADGPRGLYLDLPPPAIPHPMYYYLRRLQPWTRADSPSPAAFDRYLYDPAQWRPVVAWSPTYQAFLARADAASPGAGHERVPLSAHRFFDAVIVLPGPYAACGAEVEAARRSS
jgi:hypothetical protein